MGKSKIEWTNAVWNPLRGCRRISPGCGGPDGGGCYAERVAARFSAKGLPFHGYAEMTTSGPRWTGKVDLIPEKLHEPMSWKVGKRIFVNSMSDIWHEDVSFTAVDEIFNIMLRCPQHTFLVLTKRARRMEEYFATGNRVDYLEKHPGIQIGVSAEDQRYFDERVSHLERIPAKVRFVSAEPLLGPIRLPERCGVEWIVLGGESGPEARLCRVGWIRSLVTQCRRAGIAVFVKQLGAHVIDRNDAGFDGHEPSNWPDGTETDDWDLDPSRQYQGADARILLKNSKGGDPEEWPEDLRVRQYPTPQVVVPK